MRSLTWYEQLQICSSTEQRHFVQFLTVAGCGNFCQLQARRYCCRRKKEVWQSKHALEHVTMTIKTTALPQETAVVVCQSAPISKAE